MSENQKKYKNFLFDCDGVILDSNQIKSEGFRIALSNEDTKLVDQFLDYHKDNQGIDRYNKIKFFLSEIKKVEYCDKDFNFIIKKYSDYCLKELVRAPLVQGITEFLEYLKQEKRNCFVVSGSDQVELREIFRVKGLDSYFSGIYGSPETKIMILNKLFQDDLINDSSIFYGDAKSDMLAAENHSIEFIYIYGASDWKSGLKECLKKKYKCYLNFEEVKKNNSFDL